MNLKSGFKQCKTDTCLLYIVNELGTVIVILYVDETLEIIYKPEFMDKIEYINKEYATRPMGELEDFAGCTIKRDLTNMTLNIYQTYLITKTIQGFNEDVKSPMTLNNPSKTHKGIVYNKEKGTNISSY